MPSPDSPVQRYHDGTKHHFNRFARSLGYLDWASQPDPFRAYHGARRVALYPAPGAERAAYTPPATTFDNLFGDNVGVEPLSLPLVGDLLRHALGLSAWKQVQSSRWSLRVNPSSGNLHPTEAYIVCGSAVRLDPDGAAVVAHYAADAHALEVRCRFDAAAWDAFSGGRELLLVVLTSIHWREAWKYGERAFRYCQHDVGHAVACVAFAAAALGWRTRLLPEWSHRQIAALTGVDRDDDFFEAEREEPACVLAIEHPGAPGGIDGPAAALVERVAMGQWEGRASQLSEDHVEWTFIDEIARGD